MRNAAPEQPRDGREQQVGAGRGGALTASRLVAAGPIDAQVVTSLRGVSSVSNRETTSTSAAPGLSLANNSGRRQFADTLSPFMHCKVCMCVCACVCFGGGSDASVEGG